MKCMDCGKHGMAWCATGETIIFSALVCQAMGNKSVIEGATKAVMATTEAPKWCPLKREAGNGKA